jgi:hypothetical protein
MSGRTLIESFDRLVAPELKRHGFRGHGGHFVKKTTDVVQVVELQVAVFGGRVTANLGLDLSWLKPATRWIERPRLGPHAHESVRWTRIGLVAPEGVDRWWDFAEGEAEACEEAAMGVGRAVVDDGLPWLELESNGAAFLRHALDRVARSKSPRHPHGRFSELRLLAAVLAWNGRREDARSAAEQARACWNEEKDRLLRARHHFRQKVRSEGRLPSVPDLVRELDRLITGPDAAG